jgi:hypothetical protein
MIMYLLHEEKGWGCSTEKIMSKGETDMQDPFQAFIGRLLSEWKWSSVSDER